MEWIGYKIAQTAKAFDMIILYHKRNQRTKEEEEAISACNCAKTDDLFQRLDFVMLVVKLTPQTWKLIGERELRLMKSTATLISISQVSSDGGAGLEGRAARLLSPDRSRCSSTPFLPLRLIHPARRDSRERAADGCTQLALRFASASPGCGPCDLMAAAAGLGGALRAAGPPLKGRLAHAAQRMRVHATACALAKRSPLRKFLSKTKKKFWYESPMLGSQLLYKPSDLEDVLKPQRKMQKEDTIRMRALNAILYKAITDLLNSTEVSEEVYDEKVEISKVQLTVDFSACRAYWVPSGLLEKDNRIQQVLEKYSPRVRHLLITQQVMGCVPPVVFVRDREQAAIAEVERLLEIADYGSEKTADVTQVLDSKHFGQLAADNTLKPTHQGSIPVSSHLPPSSPELDLFGINHDLLNKQILEYKKKNTQKLLETNNLTLSERHLEQIAQLKKLKEKKKKFDSRFDDITPELYLLEKYNMNYLNTFSDTEEELKELGEEIKELELEEEDPENQLKIPKDLK
ncbi:putative ribosome-binding factor A, mitochondrial [Pristis pectinata]|uniref:putative ribosome-binding factor A, mitochondrial n=1 Tax=Pristis pectinata TaxID=685728 RepID=UPI00223D34DA|nr:putative ribosome-binding factor A, mitochondrial [Pristis pectinata]